MVTNISASPAASANKLVEALKAQSSRVNDAATKIVRAHTNVQNKFTANSVAEPPATRLKAETFLATAEEPSRDVISPQIDLMQAKHAYQATATALKVVNDLERETINMLK